MRPASFFIAISLALVLSGPAVAAWTVRDQGAGMEAFTRNRAGTVALVLSCRPGAAAMLKIVIPAGSGWSPMATARLDIDGTEFPVAAEGGSDQVILSDIGGGLGLADATLQAIRAGRILTLTGLAAQAMTVAARSFDLAGSGKAIERLSARCGLRQATPLSGALAGAALPLMPGEYSTGRCTSPPDPLRSIGIYTYKEGPDAGQQFISLSEDGYSSFCPVKGKLAISGNVYSGAPACNSGTQDATDLGRYKFSFQIIDSRTFISNGETYAWCAAHL